MKKNFKNIILIILSVLILFACVFVVVQAVRAKIQEVKNPILTLEVENYGNIKIELYPEYAPNTVKNIIKLAEKGYYDGKVFYGKDDISIYVGRNSEGDIDYPKLSTLESEVASEDDYEYEIKGEFVANNFYQNTLKHEKGVVSLVRAEYTQISSSLIEESYNSGSSQFTILIENERNLNGRYAAFGKVIEGMEIVEKIALQNVKKSENETNSDSAGISQFITFPIITKATVETFGINYGFPEVHEAFDYNAYMQDFLTQYYTTNQ